MLDLVDRGRHPRIELPTYHMPGVHAMYLLDSQSGFASFFFSRSFESNQNRSKDYKYFHASEAIGNLGL